MNKIMYITCDINKKDGFGSQFGNVISCYATCYYLKNMGINVKYLHTPVISGRIYSGPNLCKNPEYISENNIKQLCDIVWIKHKDNESMMNRIYQQQIKILSNTLKFDDFFNLRKDEVIYCSKEGRETEKNICSELTVEDIKKISESNNKLCLVNAYIKGIDTSSIISDEKFINTIKNKLSPLYPMKMYSGKKNITIHIRRGDVCDPNCIKYKPKKKRCFERLYTDDNIYLNIIELLEKKFSQDIVINIYSLKKNFNAKMYKKFKTVNLHLSDMTLDNNNDVNDIQDMIYSDIHFVSKSSYSKIVSIYHTGLQFYNLDKSGVNMPIIKNNNKMFDYSQLTETEFIDIMKNILYSS